MDRIVRAGGRHRDLMLPLPPGDDDVHGSSATVPEKERPAYAVEEAAAACGVSEKTIERAIGTGRLRMKRTSVNAHGDSVGKRFILRSERLVTFRAGR